MEFPGVGVVKLDLPSEDLKPFFRRKYKTVFRSYRTPGSSSLEREKMIERVNNIAYDDEDEKNELFCKMTDVVDKVIMFGRNRITEEEFVNEWMKLVFGSEQKRRESAELFKELLTVSFQTVDSDGSGVIEYDEFEKWFKLRGANHDMTKTVFNALDSDNDGVISLDEWIFSAMTFTFSSGPQDVFSLWWGPLVED